VRFSKFRDRVELPRARRQEALTELVTDYAKALEGLCSESPYDWFNFYPFWEAANVQGPVAGN
jgi:predicted LPLAT superfamily acyltransferase